MHKTEFKYCVPYFDTDQMGVIYHGNYLRYFEMVRNQFLRDIGYPYTKMESEGTMLPVVQAQVDYKSPGFFEDELTFIAQISKFKGCRIHFEHEIINQDEKLLAKGYTTHCFMCKTKRKPIPVTESFIKILTDKGII
ncbi:MAG: acyl-CoA thioesterase [Lentisphaerales bacterium]|nr:acyl-CoA thioesterase [Lentisphaerales bacterium]